MRPIAHPTLSVLCVDRSADINDLLASLLELEGHRVISTNSGDEALLLARLAPPDVIFTSMLTRDRSGYALLASIRTISELDDCMVVALSGRARDQEISAGIGVGFDDYLTKPASFERILRVLRRVSDRVSNRRIGQKSTLGE